MALLGLVFVWAIIQIMTTMKISNKRVRKFENSVRRNVLQTDTLFTRDEYSDSYQNDKSYITKKLKDQIINLYESDCDKSGRNVEKIVELLSMFRKHHDTSELLDDNPYILDYIFGNSA